MSRNNKNARLHHEARERSKQRQNGTKGASKTQPLHGKRWTYRGNPEIQKRIAEMVKATSEKDKTGGKKFLESAGSAADDRANAEKYRPDARAVADNGR